MTSNELRRQARLRASQEAGRIVRYRPSKLKQYGLFALLCAAVFLLLCWGTVEFLACAVGG